MMKKLLYFFTAILLISCSSSDDSPSSSKSNLNPPKWIQGKWRMGTGDAQSGYEFKSNDWCTVGYGLSTCWNSTINDSNGQLKADETVSESTYTTKLTVGGITQTHTFIKIAENKIRAVTPTSSGLVYIKK